MSDFPPPPHQNSEFSNYPRGNFVPNGPGRPPGVYFDYIGEAWKIVNSDMGTWVVATLIMFGVTYGVNMVISIFNNLLMYGSLSLVSSRGANGLSIAGLIGAVLLSFAGGMLTYPIQAGLMMMGVRRVRGYAVSPTDLFAGYKGGWRLILAYTLASIITGIGTLLFLIPGFYALGVLAFVPLLVLDRNASVIDSLTISYEALKREAWSMFGFMFLLGIVVMLGFCACGVGALFSYPVFILALALTYNNYFPDESLQSASYYQQIGSEPPR